jgi:hypothetical protein
MAAVKLCHWNCQMRLQTGDGDAIAAFSGYLFVLVHKVVRPTHWQPWRADSRTSAWFRAVHDHVLKLNHTWRKPSLGTSWRLILSINNRKGRENFWNFKVSRTVELAFTLYKMRFLLRVEGITKLDRVKNEDVRKVLGIYAMNDKIKQNRTDWRKHIDRTNNERLTKQIREYNPRGRRSVGRPRRRWSELEGWCIS